MVQHADIDHTGITGVGGAASLTYVQNKLSADVAMATSGTFYDGPAVTLSAGTWYLAGTITHDGDASGVLLIAKLWDGTTVAASSEQLEYGGAANRDYASISLHAVVVVAAGTPTWKISATTNGNTTNMRAAVGQGNNACVLVGIKIAP